MPQTRTRPAPAVDGRAIGDLPEARPAACRSPLTRPRSTALPSTQSFWPAQPAWRRRRTARCPSAKVTIGMMSAISARQRRRVEQERARSHCDDPPAQDFRPGPRFLSGPRPADMGCAIIRIFVSALTSSTRSSRPGARNRYRAGGRRSIGNSSEGHGLQPVPRAGQSSFVDIIRLSATGQVTLPVHSNLDVALRCWLCELERVNPFSCGDEACMNGLGIRVSLPRSAACGALATLALIAGLLYPRRPLPSRNLQTVTAAKPRGARHRRGRRVRRHARSRRRGRGALPAWPAISNSAHFTDGALVKQGDLLFTIDQRPFQAAFDAAKSRVDVASSLLDFTRLQLNAPRISPTAAISRPPRSTTGAASSWPAEAGSQGANADLTTASLNSSSPRSRRHYRAHRPPPRFRRQPLCAAGSDGAHDDRDA